MAWVIHGETITAAWLAALEYLDAHEREAFDLLVEIADPSPDAADRTVIAALDALLFTRRHHRVDTVVNTIFPVRLAGTSPDRTTLYTRYRQLLPRLRGLAGNTRGLYFERLIDYPLHKAGTETPVNQLEVLIADLKGQLARKGSLRHAYEAQIFAPGKDRLPQGFPCMSSLSFHLDQGALRLSATYRNQYFVQRALGNYLGLAHLQRFVAAAVGLAAGPLTVHAFHAAIDPAIGVQATRALIRACRAHTTHRPALARAASSERFAYAVTVPTPRAAAGDH